MASQEVLTALETLHREIEKLEPAIKHVETAQQVIQTVKGIPQKHLELLQELKNNDVSHKDELKHLFAKELLGFTEENTKLQRVTSEIQQQVKLEQEALSMLKESVQSFHEKIENINFPERLQNLDARIVDLNAATEILQSTLDELKTNTIDRLRDIQNYQRETRAALQSGLEHSKTALQSAGDAAAKKQQIFTFVTWFLIVAGVIAVLLSG